MRGERIARIPDDWTVWTFSDPHGVATGLEAALIESGLVDAALAWRAPPRTALVGCGDYLDRGADSRGVLALLRRLQVEAEAAGSRVVLTRGNHEETILHLRAGRHEWLPVWLAYGGLATLESFRIALGAPERIEVALAGLDEMAPGLFDWLADMPQAATWRDIVFVHGGLPADAGIDDLGLTTDRHLWIRHEFFTTPWASGAFDGFVADGIERVVFGHTPQPAGVRVMQGGRMFAIDSNACGNPRMPPDAQLMITLVEVGDGGFDQSRCVIVPTDTAPDRTRVPDPPEPMLDYR